MVSIPFRAVTGFEPLYHRHFADLLFVVSIPFRAVTGFERRGVAFMRTTNGGVSIPFRAVTGFEPNIEVKTGDKLHMFQSLSGLSLGLNGWKGRNTPHRP